MKNGLKLLMMSILSNLFFGCNSEIENRFATEAPIRKITCSLPFSSDFIYQPSPDSNIILGRKRIEPAIFEISGFEILSGKKLWQLDFQGEIVGQTSKEIIVYEASKESVHFVNPINGQTTRKITPAPSPLSSKNGFEAGMAFTDEMYLTTKALYTQVIENGKIDTTWQIGITAKTWNDNITKWFVSPVNQIYLLEHKLIINKDKVLIINTKKSIDGGHSYQIISLETGKELLITTTEGEFIFLNSKYFIEKTSSHIRCFEPFTKQEYWKIYDNFKGSVIYSVGNQISIITKTKDKTRSVKQLNAQSGRTLKTFELPNFGNTILNKIFLRNDKEIWLNFSKDTYKIAEERPYDYWVGYDEVSKKALWRTDFDNKSTSSLFQFFSDKMILEK